MHSSKKCPGYGVSTKKYPLEVRTLFLLSSKARLWPPQMLQRLLHPRLPMSSSSYQHQSVPALPFPQSMNSCNYISPLIYSPSQLSFLKPHRIITDFILFPYLYFLSILGHLFAGFYVLRGKGRSSCFRGYTVSHLPRRVPRALVI